MLICWCWWSLSRAIHRSRGLRQKHFPSSLPNGHFPLMATDDPAMDQTDVNVNRHFHPFPNLFLGFFSTSAAIKRKVVETMIKVQWRIDNLSTNFLKLEREESIQMQSEIYRPLKYNRNICKRCTMNVMFLFKNSANDEKFIKSAWNDSWNCRELNLSKYQPLNAFIVRISDWKPVADPPTVPLFKINASASSSRF